MACKSSKAQMGEELKAKAGKCGMKTSKSKKCNNGGIVQGGAFDKTVNWG